ncbi:hypothetical protein B0H19DRAFT_1075783 [Mycena capillaripes]|nr:hypothetical protein B0H19DRAFT_1075783 [Mycena capillaripes]
MYNKPTFLNTHPLTQVVGIFPNWVTWKTQIAVKLPFINGSLLRASTNENEMVRALGRGPTQNDEACNCIIPSRLGTVVEFWPRKDAYIYHLRRHPEKSLSRGRIARESILNSCRSALELLVLVEYHSQGKHRNHNGTSIGRKDIDMAAAVAQPPFLGVCY